jgi:hypothetical protein
MVAGRAQRALFNSTRIVSDDANQRDSGWGIEHEGKRRDVPFPLTLCLFRTNGRACDLSIPCTSN